MSTNSNNNDTTQPDIPPSLSHLAPLTKNELLLLSTYDKIKQYEKIAAKLKAKEAKRRLDEADERYRAKVRERERLENGGDEHAENDNKIEGDNYSAAANIRQQDSSDDEEDEATKQQRLEKQKQRQLEIKQLRSEIEAKSQQEAERDAARKRVEDMRKELLGPEGTKKKKRAREESSGGEEQLKMTLLESNVNNDHDILQQQQQEDDDDMDQMESQSNNNNNNNSAILSGPSIKKKRLTSPTSSTTQSTSLIANLNGNITPIHDFSSKLQMSKTSLDGSILFPTTIGQPPWKPPAKPTNFMDGCFELDLPNFNADNLSNPNSNNTLAVKFSAPQESARFSVNIATADHNGYDSVLFHFNPRQFQRGGQLVINSKEESMWGNDLSVPLSTLPLVFGKAACTLIVQINEEGFDVFVEGQHCARLEHRMALPKGRGSSLCLQFPASDDYGNPEDWEVYRVWWGRKNSMAGSDLSGVAGVNIYSSVHPKKLFVSGLTKVHSDPEVDLRRAELERAFRKYGGPNGAVFVSVQKDSTFAFVEVASEQQADLALVEMAGRYRVNKARRTKHEALMEERAAREAAEKGIAKESVDWD